MRQPALFQSTRFTHKLVLGLGVVCILIMPVDYRGGAAISHPHAALQLVADFGRGSLNHHHPTIDDSGHRHDSSAPRVRRFPEFDLRRQPDEIDAGPAGAVGVRPSFTASAIAATVLMTVAGDQPAVTDGDDPALSPRASGTYALYAVLLPILMMLASRWPSSRSDWREPAMWHGRSPRPESPPPQVHPGIQSFTLTASAGSIGPAYR